jgi:hypothetical protein
MHEDAVGQVAFDPADMVKAVLLESQSPVVKVSTRRKKRLGDLWVISTAANPMQQYEPRTAAPS